MDKTRTYRKESIYKTDNRRTSLELFKDIENRLTKKPPAGQKRESNTRNPQLQNNQSPLSSQGRLYNTDRVQFIKKKYSPELRKKESLAARRKVDNLNVQHVKALHEGRQDNSYGDSFVCKLISRSPLSRNLVSSQINLNPRKSKEARDLSKQFTKRSLRR